MTKKDKTVILFGFIPMLLIIEVVIINFILKLLSASSDIAVFVGLFGIAMFIIGNYYFIKYFINYLKTKKEK